MALEVSRAAELAALVRLMQDLGYRIERAAERLVEEEQRRHAEQAGEPQEIPY